MAKNTRLKKSTGEQLKKVKPERKLDFRFERNDLRYQTKDLPSRDYILGRIEEIPDGDINALIILRDKIYTHYKIKTRDA